MDPFPNRSQTLLVRFWLHFGSHFGSFFGHFLGLAAKVKIELPSRRELNFQGSGPPQIDIFSLLFLCPSWERLRILLFPNFGRFWACFGVHLGLLGCSFSNLFFIIFWDTLLKPIFCHKILQKGRGAFLLQIPYPSPLELSPTTYDAKASNLQAWP